ncbi:MAG: hypothetical protein OEQ30_08250 [Gammaproteobacteria bacterium]|jgi:hypothetical protein|nr:hypothetical protein [Gammaproteobacteria bacterium]MDH3849362.1 hypothetical protein [Gammaproteobacteria bacterium]MDH3904851.1 hypothetical protein [Gammaproteobacteria bacterium]MDH4004242.1 hypothetical protein [Gammaproteobacteria bacterium]
MNSKTLALLCSLAVAAGCAADTNIAGTYEPSCIAFEGNTIELSDNRFTWDKFTDEVTVDNDGNKIDPFPGFPVRGTYVVEDDVVRLVTDVGELAGEMHLVRRPDQVYLLTGAEFESWQRDKAVPTCALLLGPGE